MSDGTQYSDHGDEPPTAVETLAAAGWDTGQMCVVLENMTQRLEVAAAEAEVLLAESKDVEADLRAQLFDSEARPVFFVQSSALPPF